MTDFSLSEELSEKLKDSGTRELAGFFGDLFSPNGLKHRLTHWLVAFPVDPVADRNTWNDERPSRAGPKIVCVRNYTLVGPTLNEGETALQINFAPAFKASDDTKMKIGDQTGEGMVYLDHETHQVRKFALRHQGTIMSRANQTFSIAYSSTLQSESDEDEP